MSEPRPIPIDEDEEEYAAGFEQWLVDGDRFVPMSKTVPALPCGDYAIKYDRNFDKSILVLKQIIDTELVKLPMSEYDDVVNDINTFWKSSEDYVKYGYVYKRGILLYGPPGCGKSSLIALLGKELIEQHGGIVINLTTSDEIFAIGEIMGYIREIEPDRKVILVIEDIDNFVGERRDMPQVTSKLINILDGKMQLDNCVIIATTNYPEELEERVSNRPSRFDLRREIGPPKMKAREFYIRHKLTKKDLSKLDMEKMLADTKGYTIDHLKELICLVYVHKRKYEDALTEVSGMIKTPKLHNTATASDKKLGFGRTSSDNDDDRKTNNK